MDDTFLATAAAVYQQAVENAYMALRTLSRVRADVADGDASASELFKYEARADRMAAVSNAVDDALSEVAQALGTFDAWASVRRSADVSAKTKHERLSLANRSVAAVVTIGTPSSNDGTCAVAKNGVVLGYVRQRLHDDEPWIAFNVASHVIGYAATRDKSVELVLKHSA